MGENMQQVIVYIKADGICTVYDKNITLGDVLKIECSDKGVLRAIKQMDLFSFNHEHAEVFSVLKVVERIHQDYPNATVMNCGETDFIVDYKKSTIKYAVLEKMKLVLVSVIVFFGSAFTIMTFHIDIGIQKTFSRFYEQLMGTEKPPVTEMELSYSVGLALGIIIFFNHFSKKKITKDPTPIEVEMQKYNDDLINTKIADANKKGHSVDVS